jgi:hypothetical protein
MTRRMVPGLVALLIGLTLIPPLAAQAGEPRAQQLRREVEQRFAAMLRQELALTDEQDTRVRAILGSHGERRRVLEVQEQVLRRALMAQLRPGIAAQPDSVDRLVLGITALRVRHAQAVQEEMVELGGALTPVQRGQLFLMRERLLQRARELREARVRRGRQPGGS